LDGAGGSGVTLDTSKIQNYLLEFEHAGGIARMGVRIGGAVIYCHQFESGNILTLPLTAWSVLPVRVEIDNTAVAASGTQLRLYSFSSLEEGRAGVFNPSTTANQGTDIFSVSDTFDVPVMSLRLKSAFNRAAFIPSQLKTLIVNNADTLIKIWFNTTLTGASWVDISDTVEQDLSATSFSGGSEVSSFYITTNESRAQKIPITVAGYSSMLDGTAIIVTLTAAKVGANGNLLTAIDFEEIS
jgi:hypothetical protein